MEPMCLRSVACSLGLCSARVQAERLWISIRVNISRKWSKIITDKGTLKIYKQVINFSANCKLYNIECFFIRWQNHIADLEPRLGRRKFSYMYVSLARFIKPDLSQLYTLHNIRLSAWAACIFDDFRRFPPLICRANHRRRIMLNRSVALLLCCLFKSGSMPEDLAP